MKLAINYNVACTIELISETYIFAEKCGLPLQEIAELSTPVVKLWEGMVPSSPRQCWIPGSSEAS
jgi:hypothetical protein